MHHGVEPGKTTPALITATSSAPAPPEVCLHGRQNTRETNHTGGKQKTRHDLLAPGLFLSPSTEPQSTRIEAASGPLAPWTTSIQIVWPSASCITFARCSAEA